MTDARDDLVAVAVTLPVSGTYTYRIPESLKTVIRSGMRVWVPFDRRRVTGYVLGPAPCHFPGNIKQILDVLDTFPLFPENMVPFFRWVASYYMHPLGMVIQSGLPAGLCAREMETVRITPQGERSLGRSVPTPMEASVLETLAGHGPMRRSDLQKTMEGGLSTQLLSRLSGKGWIQIEREVLPPATRHRTGRFVQLIRPVKPMGNLSAVKKAIVSHLEQLDPEEPTAADALKDRFPTLSHHLKGLEKEGFVRIEARALYRDPLGDAVLPDRPPCPTAEQQAAIDAVEQILGKGYGAFLITGVTGSGKTEVYLRLSEKCMEMGLPVLVLVPEIALISQMEHRFRARFGDCLAVLHSALSPGERFDQWVRISKGEVPVALGTRSGIFAPFPRLGLIIVDEEHDGSYKQESGLRYNARDLAVLRARQLGCPVVLGSATPSVQSTYNAATEKFTPLHLRHRVADRPLARVITVDLKSGARRKGAALFFSPELIRTMTETLKSGDQILLFLNRRGYAAFPVCAGCGEPIRCRHCDITLTLHQREKRYRCHYCGYSLPAAARCPACLGGDIRLLGLGTEKIEETVASLFPDARVARMDADTARKKGAVVQILKALRQRTVDIVIGTQMVAKGHDFPGITLVGILCADLTLSFPDFRAGERTFQLLAQVAGRAGRGDKPGQVILQTYNPDHFVIRAAQAQDVNAFYEQEIASRRALGYPPFARMVHLRVEGKHPEKAAHWARVIADRCRQAADCTRGVQVLGPIEAPISRIAGHHRWQILLKGEKSAPLRQTVETSIRESGAPPGGVRIHVDVDPYDMI